MELVNADSLTELQCQQILQLWNNNYPSALAFSDVSGLKNYLDGLADCKYSLMVDETIGIVGWSALFERDQAWWFAVIVDGRKQGVGIGTSMLEDLKLKSDLLNGWVIDHDDYLKLDGTKYASPIQFYLKNGFKAVTEERLENNEISAVKVIWSRP